MGLREPADGGRRGGGAGDDATALLTALRKADVPVSTSGLPETEAAAMVCDQLAAGADEAALIRAVPALLPAVPDEQAGVVVEAARAHYC